MGKEKILKPPRVVLDSNCVVSALVFSRGRLAWLREAWTRQRFVPLVSKDTASELIRVLTYPKFHLSSVEQEALLADYLPFAETVKVEKVPAGLPVLRDPGDVPFLALAVTAKADALVSGDGDLEVLRPVFKGIAVMAAADFSGWLDARV